MSTHYRVVGGDRVRLVALPAYTRANVARWLEFLSRDSILGLDVETTAIGLLGAFDPTIKTRLVQFGTATEAWTLDPADPRWRRRIVAALSDPSKRFVSHNSGFDATRVFYEFGISLGDRAIDTLPMASLLHPGRTAPNGHGLKGMCRQYIDSGLADADQELHGRFADLYYSQQKRKTALLPASFEPGVSPCRHTSKALPRCPEPSWEGSLCGLCREHYLTRRVTSEIEVWGWNHIALDDPVYLGYAGLDAIYVRRLLNILNRLIRAAHMSPLSRTEQKVGRLMTAISVKGLRVDREWTRDVLDEVGGEFTEAEERLLDVTGLKARSPKMRAWLSERGVVTRSLDKEHLPALVEEFGDEPEVGEVLHGLTAVSTHSNLLTNLRTIIKHADEGDGYVHPNIITQQAHTGRMSVTQPALQTLAKAGLKGERLRGCFVARDGHALIGADYDSQEIRIAAALSKDPALLRIVHEGLNQHVLTAESIFPDFEGKKESPLQYHQAKTLDFAQQYGAMPRKIAMTLSIPEREATILWQKWRATYAGLVKWSAEVARQVEVVNCYGRVIPADLHRDYANANYLIQSTGRDVLGAAIVALDEAGWGDTLWLPIHDELVLEVPEDLVDDGLGVLEDAMYAVVEGIEITASAEVIGHRWRGLA